MKSLALLSAALLTCLAAARAQDALALYHWEAVPKRLLLNPAARVEHRAWLSLPVVGHVGTSLQLPWSTANVLALGDRGLAEAFGEGVEDLPLDVPAVIRGVEGVGQVRLTSRVNLLSAGVNTRAGLFSLHLDQQVDAHAAIGPAPARGLYFGEAAVLADGLDVRGTHYDASVRTALALGYQVAPRHTGWRLGVNVKVTKTQAHARLADIDSEVIRTDTGVAVLFTGAQQVGGLSDVYEGRVDGDELGVGRLLAGGNLGLGVDLGAAYLIGERLELSASVTDLGFQRLGWESGEYGFRERLTVGESEPLSSREVVTVGEFVEEGDALGNAGRDSLTNRDAYTRPLPAAVYLGGEYRFAGDHALGLTVRNSLRNGRLQTATAVSLHLRPHRSLEANASVTYSNLGGVGVGFGASLQLAVLQVYAGSDNVLALVRPEGARWGSAVAGVTLLLPRRRPSRGLGTMRQRTRVGGRGIRCPKF